MQFISVGRRKGLVVTLALMTAGTMLIAFVPGHATLGATAPLLVVVGRPLQGFSAGVEQSLKGTLDPCQR